MKDTRQRRNLSWLVLGVLIFALLSIGAMPQKKHGQSPVIDSYLAAQDNKSLGDEEKIKVAINAYFTLRYEGQKNLELRDFSVLLKDKTSDWVIKETDKREVELAIASMYGLGYEKYSFTLDYDSIEINKTQAVVQLREGHEVIFKAHAPEPSYLYNLKHVFNLEKIGNKWVIVEDKYQDDLTPLMENETKEQILSRLQSDYEEEKRMIASNLFQNTPNEKDWLTKPAIPDFPTNDESPEITPSVSFHSYDRTAAVNYANVWASNDPNTQLRNPTWGNFDGQVLGGDCTNYVSQVIWNGAPQMDNTGSYQWYYFGYGDRSPAWTDVSALYTYLTSNYYTGPVGTEISASSACTLSPGDIIQAQGASGWFHTIVVVEVAPNCNVVGPNNAIYYNAHTNDRKHYPLSYLSAYIKRYIKITGYYDGTPYNTFVDVPPSHPYHSDVESLYASAITTGCSTTPKAYCPDANLTRAQMSVFILRGMYGANYTPPTGGSTGFNDVPTSYWAAYWIKAFAEAGITGGCGNGNFCPEGLATNAQMAVFLLRARHGSDYQPPSVGSATGFYDVPIDHWAAAWIKQMSVEGISYGCGNGNYCPEQPITRAEMARLLVNAFNLP
ncbi:MAG: amidase domain-containing protein [Chloroflexi bacterium]|nr:amidase domain-containing protein [Chloroflexota bacterium]